MRKNEYPRLINENFGSATPRWMVHARGIDFIENTSDQLGRIHVPNGFGKMLEIIVAGEADLQDEKLLSWPVHQITMEWPVGGEPPEL